MRNFLTAVFFCLPACFCQAQQNEIDSFLNILKEHPGEDTLRLTMLYYVAFDYHQENPDKGLLYADELIELAKKMNHPKDEGNGYFSRGLNYWALGKYDAALNAYKTAENIFRKSGLGKKAANVNNSMAIVYQNLSDYPGAMAVYLKNLRYFESLHDSSMIAVTYGNMGIVYDKLNQYKKAIECHEKSISIHEKSGNKKSLADGYGNIGNVYDDQDNPSKAIAYYHRALEISQSINYTKGIASNYSNLGIASITTGDYSEAYKYLNLALPAYRLSGDKLNEAIVLKSTGDVFFQADKNFFSNQHLVIEKRYAVAKNYFDSSLSLLTELEEISGQAEAWEKIASVYEKQQDFQQALQAHKKFVTLKDSVLNDEKNTAISGMEIKYTFDKREDSLKAEHDKKVLLAKAEIDRQSTIKNAIGWGSLILLTAALISFIFYKKRRDAKQKQQEAEFKTEVADTEMKALRAQMNPHFIFNSLNSVSNYIAKNDVQEADRYLSKFAKLMRMILENSEQKEVLLTDDLKALELYMNLEAMRMNNKFTYEIMVDKEIDKENILVPPLILQPFVENSIWHGIAEKEGPGKILIHIKKEGADMINCIVEDDGIGRRQSANIKATVPQQEKNSLGMKITQTRIDILNKIKNTKAAVELSDLAQGLRVEVKLPLATNF